MNELSIAPMTKQDRQISEIFAAERSRLRNFIRRRVPDPSDAEDIVQDVFYKLVEANRLLMPIDHVTGWLFHVARKDSSDIGDQDDEVLASKICCHRPMPGRKRSTSAECCLMSWNLRSTNCPMINQ